MEQPDLIYKITLETFVYKNEIYSIALSPELFAEGNGLEFSGGYTGLLIDPNKGTLHIDLLPDGNGHWDVEPRGIDPNVIDEIEKIISKMRQN